MAITENRSKRVFNTDEIHRGDFIRLQETEDSEAVNGIVSMVRPHAMTVFYLPQMSNVSNYIMIRADEADDWYAMSWSSDFSDIKTKESVQGDDVDDDF